MSAVGGDALYPLTDETPSAFIQWKGTNVCLDFHCECGWSGHLDGYFAHAIRCGGCGCSWQMPTTVPLRPNAHPCPPLTPEEHA